VDYLLKPIEESALKKSLEKYRNIYQTSDTQLNKINTLYNQIVRSYKSRFFVKIGNHFHSIAVNEIQCFLIQERATFLRTMNGKKYDLDYSLDQIQKLVDPNIFFRINRNYLIHIDSIQDIFSYSSNRLGVKLKMLDHLDMIVSRDKVADFKKWLDR
jgi:DNA-binding LytR/AlgR family response regulator